MASFKHDWHLWLRPNRFTKKLEDAYIAEVETSGGTMRNEDIAERMVSERCGIKYDMLLLVINRYEDLVRELLMSGYRVSTGLCYFAPRVKGTWSDEDTCFDPSRHRVTVDIVPSRKMRDALALVGVKVLDIKGDSAFITLVEDISTHLTDDTVTIDRLFLIKGKKIKVEGGDGAGVYLVHTQDDTVRFECPLVQNQSKTIIACIPPAMEPGMYRLRIVTRFSGGGDLLKQPRTIDYPNLLTLKRAEEEAK